ncbi:MAG TPA: hypothetical protein VMP10_03305 [Chloroflexota bacterium]|nr:hypothetical protein [Chloroflexota bacterium]
MGRLRAALQGIPDVMWVTGLVAGLGLTAIALLVMTSMAIGQRPAKPEKSLAFEFTLTMTPEVEISATPTAALVVADETPTPESSPSAVAVTPKPAPSAVAVAPKPAPQQPDPEPTPTPLPLIVKSPPAPTATAPSATKVGVIYSPAGQRAMLRAGPSRNDAIVGRIPAGTEVGIVTATSGEEIEPGENRWFEVRWQTSVGYVYAPLVAPR